MQKKDDMGRWQCAAGKFICERRWGSEAILGTGPLQGCLSWATCIRRASNEKSSADTGPLRADTLKQIPISTMRWVNTCSGCLGHGSTCHYNSTRTELASGQKGCYCRPAQMGPTYLHNRRDGASQSFPVPYSQLIRSYLPATDFESLHHAILSLAASLLMFLAERRDRSRHRFLPLKTFLPNRDP